ncbi:S-adenosylmethionine: 2-demethylmenaquinone methyltransferase [Streptomyces caelestis]|uniref:RraA family protein n=1 Tax=Streptomyces caelestis TaxID=36816 RepID=UPI003662FA46
MLGVLMAARAPGDGWAGTVVYGAVRDTAAPAGMDLGVQALGTRPRKSAKAGEGAVDVPVSFGGVPLSPGDVLHADDDGVVPPPRG